MADRRRLRSAGVLLGAIALGSILALVPLSTNRGRRILDRVGRWIGTRAPPSNEQFAFASAEVARPPELDGVLSPAHPEWEVRRGLDVVRVATGFTFPVNLAFASNAGPGPGDPLVYVTELHGDVRYVARDGSVGTFATGLKNFAPDDSMADTHEVGLTGICALPDSEDLLVTVVHQDPATGLLSNRILRLVSEAGGRSMRRAEVFLDLEDYTSPSHQIQRVAHGPDGKIWVSLGDGFDAPGACDPSKFAGKILRMNPDATPCADNPFFDEYADTTPTHYVFASGFRNPFGFDFQPGTGRLYASDNGMRVDRFFLAQRGASYGWDGREHSSRLNALFSWGPESNPGLGAVAFLHRDSLGPGSAGRCYVALVGRPRDRDPRYRDVWEFRPSRETGLLDRAPEPVVKYVGKGRGSAVGLAEGPDGLWFTDVFGESENDGAAAGFGSVWKLVPSAATLGLPSADQESLASLPPADRGRVEFMRSCTVCHAVEGTGGSEGPDLTHAASNLERRLGSRAYEAHVDKLLESADPFIAKQRPRLRVVRDAPGPERVRTWLVHHIEEPRFDNRFAKMPGFAEVLTARSRDDLIEFLLTRK